MSVGGRWRQWVCGILIAAVVAGCSPSGGSDGPDEGVEPLEYQAVEDLCALDLTELFVAPAREPHSSSYTAEYGGDTSLTCQIDFYDSAVEPGEGGALMVAVQVLPQHDPDATFSPTAAELYETGQQSRREEGERSQDLPGLGSGAEWSTDGRDVTLVGYDGNLLFDVRWFHDLRTPLSPPDLLQRLVQVAGVVLTGLRLPGLPPPLLLAASAAPTISAEDVPPPVISGGYQAVDNLCDVVDVSSLGPAGAMQHSNTYGSDDITMTCSVDIGMASGAGRVVITARVIDGLADDAYAAYLTALPGQTPADQPFVGAMGSRYTIDNGGQTSHLVVHNLNMVIYIIYTAVPYPDNVGDELAAVAESLLSGLLAS